MRSVIRIGLALVLMIGAAGFTAAEEQASPTPESVITFVTQDFPPFSYRQDGQLRGAMVELIDRICVEMRRRCEHQLLPWLRAQRRVKQGVVDGLYAIGWHSAREEWLIFSPPMLSTEYGFFVHRRNPVSIGTKEDLRGYRIGVYGPSNTSRSLQAFLGESDLFEIRMTPGDEAGFRQLPVGRVDAVYSNRAVGEAMIERLGLKDIRYAGQHRPLDYYVGFSRRYADPDMVQQFVAAFRKLQATGEINRILSGYRLQPAIAEEDISE